METYTMTRSNPSDLSTTAITANLRKMHELLLIAINQRSLAEEPLGRGDLSQTFGALTGIDSTLEEARTLHRAAVFLHQWRRN
jgi:hypothetical protein